MIHIQFPFPGEHPDDDQLLKSPHEGTDAQTNLFLYQVRSPSKTQSYNEWILQNYCKLLTSISKLLFHRMSLERDLELVMSLTQYPITHRPFKMLRRTLTLRKHPKRQISARSWEYFSPVSRTSLVSFSSFGWRGLWALAVPSRGSLLYFFVAAL